MMWESLRYALGNWWSLSCFLWHSPIIVRDKHNKRRDHWKCRRCGQRLEHRGVPGRVEEALSGYAIVRED